MPKQLNQLIVLASSALAMSGCAYSIHQVHTSDFLPYARIESGKVVSARTEQFVVLGFVGDTAYVNKAYSMLMNQCQGGNVTGVTTQISTDLGFLSYTNVALMQGLCVGTTAKN